MLVMLSLTYPETRDRDERDRDERQKLDSKSRKCYFLGYGKETKGYRLYDIKRGKVFHSRDVVFNEKKRVEQQVVEIENKRHFVELEICDNTDFTPEVLNQQRR